MIQNTSKNTIIAQKITVADSLLSRMTGLLNRSSLPTGEALLINRCQSIHMFFMRFSIDVIFVNRAMKVVGVVKRIKPNRISPIFFRARSAIEVAEGVIDQTQTALGDQIQIN